MFAYVFAAVSLTNGVSIQCNFGNDYWNSIGDSVYSCLNAVIISDDNLTHVIDIIGIHESGKTNEDVKAFWIESSHKQFARLPKGFEKIFVNMIVYAWGYGALTTLTADDLKPYPQLQRLDAYDNKLTSLDGDLFKYTPKLVYLHFRGNPLLHVGIGLLDGLHSLKRAYFELNDCINMGAETPTQIRQLKLKLWNQCPPLKIESGECSIKCMERIETLEEENKRQSEEIVKHREENARQADEISKQSDKIAANSDAIQELEKQMRELSTRPLSYEIITDTQASPENVPVSSS